MSTGNEILLPFLSKIKDHVQQNTFYLILNQLSTQNLSVRDKRIIFLNILKNYTFGLFLSFPVTIGIVTEHT